MRLIGQYLAFNSPGLFACEYGVTLGQVKTDIKSNEITAIPELLQMLDIAGAIITIDAMGTQRKIAESIANKKADYVLALKGNQGSLGDDVELFFSTPSPTINFEIAETIDKGHGRIETRTCRTTQDIKWLKERHPKWINLNSIIEISSRREINGQVSTEKRYYISSLKKDAQKLLSYTRKHWGVENQLHWVLDMTFQDDQCRIRKGNAPQNMVILKNVALNLMNATKKCEKYKRISLKRMRKLAGWDSSFMTAVLNAKF